MTEQELEIIRLRIRLDVQQVLTHNLYTLLANSSPGLAHGFRQIFATLRAKQYDIVFKQVNPVYSDMMIGEYQEALDEYLNGIEAGFDE